MYAAGYGLWADAEQAEGFGLERGGAGEDVGGHGSGHGGPDAVAGEGGEVAEQHPDGGAVRPDVALSATASRCAAANLLSVADARSVPPCGVLEAPRGCFGAVCDGEEKPSYMGK